MKFRLQFAFIRRISISRRLMLSFLLVAVIPVVLVDVFSWHKANMLLRGRSADYTRQITRVLARNLEHEIGKYEALADEFMLSEEIQKGLGGFEELTGIGKIDFIKDINRFINRKYSLVSYISDVKLLLPSGLPVYGQGYVYAGDEDMADIYHSIIAEGINWYSRDVGGRNYIIMTRQVNSGKTSANIGYLVFFIDEASFFSIYSDLNLGAGSNICIVDGRGNVLSSQDRSFLPGRTAQLPAAGGYLEQVKRQGTYQTDTGTAVLSGVYIPSADWSLVSFIPSAYFKKETQDILFTMVFVTACCVAVSLVVSGSIQKSIADPLAYLVRMISESAETRFESDIEDESRDELGFCARSFRDITRQMKLLVEQVQDEQRLKREYEIRMLQAQINPHFLFNTLNSLRWTAMMSHADSVSGGLGALSELLRSTIVDKNEFITIADEIKNIENYLVIQKLRYGDMFEITINADPAASLFLIPKLLLQPVVENSILHGLDENRNNLLGVTVYKKDGSVCIDITDNGRGFDMSAGEDGGNTGSGRLSGIGLENVRERIRLHFGSAGKFSVVSIPGEGTSVHIVLPEVLHV